LNISKTVGLQFIIEQHYMSKIAAFPLELVLLPNEQQALHLFEGRYRQLYEHHKNGEPFVIVYQSSGKLSAYGSLVKIDQTAEIYPDGTIDVIIKGIAAFAIHNFEEKGKKTLYPIVKGEKILPDGKADQTLKSIFNTYLSKMCKKPPINKEFDLFYIAQRLNLDNIQKKKLMLMIENQKMNRYLLNQIKLVSSCLEQEEKLKQKFHLN